MKVLVAGWFSFDHRNATAGDLLAAEVVCDWLDAAGHPYDVALGAPFVGGVDWLSADPASYSHAIFVCGPVGKGRPLDDFVKRFSSSQLIGLNLSMIEPVDEWNPFDLLIERDSTRTARPELAFLAAARRIPVIGVCLVHPQAEYKDKGLHGVANAAIQRLLVSRELSVISIDTGAGATKIGSLRSPSEVESRIARTDVLVTTRLHGMVLALKNGVPAIAVDPIAGGAKVRTQAETIGWPVIFTADQVTDQELQQALDYCLTDAARTKARECAGFARQELAKVEQQLVAVLAAHPGSAPTSPAAPAQGSCQQWRMHISPPPTMRQRVLGTLVDQVRSVLPTGHVPPALRRKVRRSLKLWR